MRRWIRLAAALYPRSRRAEFGQEFRGNVLRGALEMRMAGG
jgi:hypothetical protein